jgi:hypothetical protein
LSGGARHCPCPSSRRLSPVPAGEMRRVPPHAHQVKKAKGVLHISRGGLEGPLPHKCRLLSSRCQRLGRGTPGGGWEGVLPSPESFFQPFPCPVKWVSISQGLPLLCLRAPDEAGGGPERAFSDGGEPLHTTPLSLAGKTYTCKGGPPDLPRPYEGHGMNTRPKNLPL